jgi:GTP cyclohydrolase I
MLFYILLFIFFSSFTNSLRIEKSIATSIKNIIKDVGENPDREGLLNKPERFSKAIIFLISGYNKDIQEVIGKEIFNEKTRDDIVIVKDI